MFSRRSAPQPESTLQNSALTRMRKPFARRKTLNSPYSQPGWPPTRLSQIDLNFDPEIRVFAGHSVGEYTALAAAGILDPEEGAKLVQRRGDIMARSGNLRAGAMSAILGMDRATLEEVCKEASTADSVAVIANDNSPGQLVISGDVDAVERAEGMAKERGAKRAIRLNVSGAFHSPLMLEASQSMAKALKQELFEEAEEEQVYSNVTAQTVTSASSWPELLEAQLRNPVRWTETIENMIASGVDTFVEFGSGEVLSGLIRRISKDVRTLAVNDPASLDSTLAALKGKGGGS